ncbi:MAG: GTP 3',8-cyclase MoaA [Chitinophagaceae bacterium]|nr:GTP 3',8-cyclase MoaA [Chitinophagaceae bacterium]
MLIDNHFRVHNYLRISLTDACNFRCLYCMPDENTPCTPHKNLMQVDEIETFVKLFISLGVNKLRLTGGEPLVRKEAEEIIDRISTYNADLHITTNGYLLKEFEPCFKKNNLKGINISLDTLDATKFFVLTQRDNFEKVMSNIDYFLGLNYSLKINVVMMKGINDNEIVDFISWTKHLPLHIRFIEFMPFDGNLWSDKKLFPMQQIIDEANDHFDIIKLQDEKNDTTKKYKVVGHQGTFAVISTMTSPFCSNCNRLRLTADGKLKNCLFSKTETDLLTPLRNKQDVKNLILETVLKKEKERGGQIFDSFSDVQAHEMKNRSMIKIGG